MPVIRVRCNHQTRYDGFVNASKDPTELVIEFLNTLDVEAGTDELASAAAFSSWAGRSQSALELRKARGLREHLRALASGDAPVGELRVPVEVALGGGAASLGARTLVGEVAAAVVTVALEGRLERIKICPADDCRWAFYDRSKNQSRSWCSMKVCGNRAKARSHRERAEAG